MLLTQFEGTIKRFTYNYYDEIGHWMLTLVLIEEQVGGWAEF